MSVLSLEAYANRNPEASGYVGATRIGQGTYKFVTQSTYKSGAPAADKFLKKGVTFSSDCFLDDLRAAEAALPYVARFHWRYIDTNPFFRGSVSIKLNMPQAWIQTDGILCGQYMLREPFIDNFQKFNSNSGAADVTAAVAQALSHYSYHASDGTELLCDLQGGRIGDSYVLSDVVMMSMTKKYGNTDLGATGIENWLHSHQCTQFCSSSWKNWSGARRLIQPAFSTTMTLDVTTAPAIGQDFVRVRPTTIKFTHDSIKDRFQDGHTLMETALQIARQDIGKRDLPMLTVVRLDDGRLFSLDNRRTIKVQVVPFHTWADEFRRKATTKTGGRTISVRQGNYQIGETLAATRIPWLQHIRNTSPVNNGMPDSQFSIFLATFTDE